MSYQAPLREMQFVIHELADLRSVQALPGCEEATDEIVGAVLEECAKLMSEVIAPLNRVGDTQPAQYADGTVTTSPGFRQAFRAFVEGGWQGVMHPTQHGGQGLPKLVATPCLEMLQSANLSFALCPLLTDGAIEAFLTAGSEQQQHLYVPKLIDGSWTGTMNLTEPQAGSDLSLVRTRAERHADGRYRIFGQKIFITYGEHDLAQNIVHLVLARTPDAPPGVKGLSLFAVPKLLPRADGTLGARNDVFCASLEHKLGIRGSPTAVLIFGDGRGEVGPGAVAELVGEENRGLESMFIMMNAARFQVGLQGIAIGERAYQQASAYARERLQSRAVEGSPGPVAIIEHPDVRRMLMLMRSHIEAARAIAYVAAAQSDLARHHPDGGERARAHALYDYLVPIVKGWSTEIAVELTSIGIQVHGGMGFIEETGAAQHYRDARILPIYEGTTAIQANDLLGRKTVRDGGASARELIEQMRTTIALVREQQAPDFAAIAARLAAAVDAYSAAVEYFLRSFDGNVRAAFAGSVPYLKLAGIVVGGWQMARAALAAQRHLAQAPGDRFYHAKIATARFFSDHVLSSAPSLLLAIEAGGAGALALDANDF
ncbi:MAG TPA: acyl-CoA dehydrogenase [Burkholderiaceae bacterium]|nr:acyl-CoA dehydrogenase [Burkholderiaceae bacterium]